MSDAQIHCASCGEILTGPFCSQCGEKRLSDNDRRFIQVLSDFFNSLTNLDGRFFRTFHHLLLKPGLYEYRYHIGARVGYIKPITIFLLINVLFVAFMPLNDFYVDFNDQQHHPYAPLITEWLNTQISDSGLTKEAFAERYDQLVKVLARSILILGVPFLLPFVMLLFRDKRYYLADHFVFCLNLYGFWLMWMLFCWWGAWLLAVLASQLGFQMPLYPLFGNTMVAGLLLYSYIAMGRMYQDGKWLRLVKMPLLILALLFSHMAYRFSQLLITVWAI